MKERFGGIRRAFRLHGAGRDVDEEIAFHLERTVEELVTSGMPPGQARAEAERRFGSPHHYRRALAKLDRGAEARRRWEGWWQDARFAARRMARWPGLTAAIVLTFALGIGANATMFGIIDRLLLTPPAHIEDAGAVRRIVAEVRTPQMVSGEIDEVITYPDLQDLAGASSFAEVAGYTGGMLTVGEGEAAEQIRSRLVTGNFFSLLGTRPALGRFFGPEEDRAGGEGVAVIGTRLWRDRFGSDPRVVGRTLDFGYGPFTVIGVAPEGFTGPELLPVDLWVPLHATLSRTLTPAAWERRTTSRNSYWVYAVGRLAPGVEPVRAEAEATALLRGARAAEGAAAPGEERSVVTAPLVQGRGPLATAEASVAKWLGGVSLLVLLIACANVANLLLARLIRQRREIGIRLALGISRRRLVAQTMTETLLLALLGAAAALLVTIWGSDLVRTALLPDIAWGESAVSGRVLVFVLVTTLLTALLSGVVPALQATRADVQTTLRGAGRGMSAPGSRTRAALTVAQAALSVVLLVGAGLFVRSLQRVHALDLGVRTENVLLAQPVFAAGLSEEERWEWYRRAEERVGQLPGVAAASAATGLPFRTVITTILRVPGLDSIPRVGGTEPFVYGVGPGYFATVDLPVIRGRGISRTDTETAGRVVVVNETMARTLWPGRDPLGECLQVGEGEDGSAPPCSEVVGVVADTRRIDLVETAAMQFYVPLAQTVVDELPHGLLVRAARDPAALVPALQREALAIGGGVRFLNVRNYGELLDDRRRSWTMGAALFTAFGVLALGVAAIGLYSVLAFGVAQRTHELGIRAALGASSGRLLGMVVGQGVRMVLAGTGIGLAVALLAGGWIAPLLFDTSPREPLVLLGVAATLLTIALGAGVLPGWRATRVDPNQALRAE